MNARAERFESLRPLLVRHAYRMLGEHGEAEDAVQDAFLRWNAALATTAVTDDRAFLRATVTRLCIDRLRSSRARRERYVGPWLPEPLVERAPGNPEAVAMLADDVSFALMLALERLSALERAAFLLHDVMDVPFAEIAATLGRSEAAVKQLASRARVNVRRLETRARMPLGEALRVRERFVAALRDDDFEALRRLLLEDVVFISDSDGKVPAAGVPVRGADRVGRLLLALAKKAPAGTEAEPVVINGCAGFIVRDGERVLQTLALEVVDGRIRALYVMRNPEKLGAIPARGARP